MIPEAGKFLESQFMIFIKHLFEDTCDIALKHVL
jgi:hypothetical protein